MRFEHQQLDIFINNIYIFIDNIYLVYIQYTYSFLGAPLYVGPTSNDPIIQHANLNLNLMKLNVKFIAKCRTKMMTSIVRKPIVFPLFLILQYQTVKYIHATQTVSEVPPSDIFKKIESSFLSGLIGDALSLGGIINYNIVLFYN